MTHTVGGGSNTGSTGDHEAGNGTLITLQSKLNVIISGLTSKEEDIHTRLQLASLASHGKKRKREVDDWLNGLQDMKQRAIDIKNSLNQFGSSYVQEEEIYLADISEKRKQIQWLTKEVEKHEKEKPSVLSNEFVGIEFGENVRKIRKLLKDDRVSIVAIHGIGGVGKTFLATYMQKKVGIPLGVKGIKLIITSRLKHVFEQMDCESINMITVSPFRDFDEAWELFLLKHGHRGTSSTLPLKWKILQDLL
ncbi:hypothetical protein ACSQ67_023272 [Phaseolus vulgaris]